MGRIQQLNENRPVLAAVAIFLCAGLMIPSVFLMTGLDEIAGGYWPAIMAITSPVIFLCACVLVFFRRTFGYILGAVAGLVALPWFILTESTPTRPSIWTGLNGPDEFNQNLKTFAALTILSVALIAAGLHAPYCACFPRAC